MKKQEPPPPPPQPYIVQVLLAPFPGLRPTDPWRTNPRTGMPVPDELAGMGFMDIAMPDRTQRVTGVRSGWR